MELFIMYFIFKMKIVNFIIYLFDCYSNKQYFKKKIKSLIFLNLKTFGTNLTKTKVKLFLGKF
jgi:hypothetical protein